MATVSGSLLFDRNRTSVASTSMAGIPNVPIVLQDTTSGNMAAVLTDASGNFSFTDVPNGSYQLVEAYGTAASATGTIDWGANATVWPMLNGGTVPPISYVTNPPTGATNLDCTIRNTRLITVTGANLTAQNFLNGPVLYTPITQSLDTGVVVSPTNLVTYFDDGTFGSFPPGTTANTGANPNPYPNIGSQFTFVQPDPSTVTPNDGQYTIQNLMNNSHSNSVGTWWIIADHTSGNETGRMMVVNGYNPGAVILSQTVTVQPNTYYLFTSWILNLCKIVAGYANPSFGVAIYDASGNVLYNQTLGDEIPINPNFPEWKQIGTVMLNPAGNTSVTIEFVSQGPAATGNDYAIDDIGLYEVDFPIYTPTKEVDNSTVELGDTVNYTVTLDYPGVIALTDVNFQDILPNGMTFVEGSVTVNGISYPTADPNVGFSVPDIEGGTSLVVSFSATATSIPSPNPAINNAQVNYSYTPVDGGIPSQFNTISNDVPVQVLAADLAIYKAVNYATITPGGFITYTITVTNNGPSDAVNTILVDNIPSEIKNTQYSIDGGTTWTQWDGTLSLGTLAASSSVIVLIQGQVTFVTTEGFTNTATISSDTTDPDLTNNTASVDVDVIPSADLSITKLASPSSVEPDGVLTYGLLVSNAGPSDAQNVTVSDTFPPELLNPTFSLDGGVTWQPWVSPYYVGTLASGATVNIIVQATVSSTASGSIENSATVTSDTQDPDLTNNTDSNTTPIDIPPVVEADLQVVKTSPATVTAGRMLTYTIAVTNNGPDTADDVTLVDAVPVLVMNPVYSTDGQQTWNAWTGTLDLGSIQSGVTEMVYIRGTVAPAASGIITNTARVASTTPDPNLLNNISTVDTTIDTSADMQITKISKPNPVIAGNTLTYTIIARNNGPSFASNVIVSDNVPSELSDVQYSLDGGLTWNIWQGSIALNTLANNASVTILIQGTVDPDLTTPITNEATVSSDTPDPDLSNNTAAETTDIEESADVAIAKSVSPNPVTAGDVATFTLAVTNNGPSRAENIVVSDTISNRITGAEYSIDNGATWQAWTGSVVIGDLEPSATLDLLIRGTVSPTASSNITNTAIVSSTTPDPDTTNNSSTIVFPVTPQIADLAITKTGSAPAVVQGDVLTYTLVVQNFGPNDALDTVVSDIIPTAIASPEYSMDGGATWSAWSGSLALGTATAGSSITILIRGTVVDDTVPITNTATVASSTQDPNLVNNSSTITTFSSHNADLSIVKTADQNPVLAGTPLTFTLTVTNNGPAVSQGVIVTDIISARMSSVEYSMDGGTTWQPWTGSVSIDSMNPGTITEILIRGDVVTTATGNIPNTAIVASTTPDPDTTNNSSFITVPITPIVPPTPPSADLWISKEASTPSVAVDDTLTYTLTIGNIGPDDATNVIITDTIPPAIANPQYSTDGGVTWQPWTGTLEISTLASGAVATVFIQGTVTDASAPIINTARITSYTQDPDLSNNHSVAVTVPESEPCPPCPPPPPESQADISVVKTVCPAVACRCDPIYYTIVVSNAGPDSAENVLLEDKIPRMIKCVKFSQDSGKTWSRWAGSLDLGTLTKNETRVITIKGIVDQCAHGLLTNTASVSSSTTDPNTANNVFAISTKVC